MDFNNDDTTVDPLVPEVEEEADADAESTVTGDVEEDESPVSVYDMNEDGELEPA
jgi:hypothetical protein